MTEQNKKTVAKTEKAEKKPSARKAAAVKEKAEKLEDAAMPEAVKDEKKAVAKKEAAKPAKKEAAKKPAKEKKESKGKKSLVSDERLYDLILRPIVTEKSTMALEQNKVLFKVRADATKPRIKQAIEELFGVTVVSVNTLKVKGKTKQFRGIEGRRSDTKKAIVTLKDGDSVDFAAGVR